MSHDRENDANSNLERLLFAMTILWRAKWRIVLGTGLFGAAGALYSLLATPIYMSRAVIYPQDVSAQADRSFSTGGLGAMLNPLQGTSYLNRMEVILRSRHLAREAIVRNDLLPALFPESWDAQAKRWRVPGNERPGLDHGIGRLQRSLSVKVDGYRQTLEMEARAASPVLAHRILQAYLATLNARAKESVVRNAEANRLFLEEQMNRTADPWIREKIQQLVIQEIETTMLLNANAFEVLEAPEVPNIRESPQRKRIVLASILAGFLFSCLAVLAWRAVSGLRAGSVEGARPARPAS